MIKLDVLWVFLTYYKTCKSVMDGAVESFSADNALLSYLSRGGDMIHDVCGLIR